jgi:5-hydroxyisourate hydrolase-like protein (transthyretin family)
MKRLNVLFAVVVLSLVACSSKEKAVNEPASLPLLPSPRTEDLQTAQDSIGRSTTSALEGKVLLQGQMPTPLANTEVGLYKKIQGKWIEITKFSTETDGSFKITQKLTRGSYELRILDKKYHGGLPVNLESTPQRDLVLFATKK